MTPSSVITEVRDLIQDTGSTFRYSDTILLRFVNQTLKRMTLLRPDLFSVIVDITTTPNVSEQELPNTAVRLVEIFRNKNGISIEEIGRDLFDRAYPQWTTDPAGVPTKYIRHSRNPRRYFLYPRPAVDTVLVGEYVVTPPTYALSDTISVLPDAYLPTLVDGTVYLAESIDNEHVNTGRAKMFYDSFVESLGVSFQSRSITDNEDTNTAQQRG